MDDRSHAREEEDVRSGEGRGLPGSTAELQETSGPFAVDVPGDGGRLFRALALEQRRPDGLGDHGPLDQRIIGAATRG